MRNTPEGGIHERFRETQEYVQGLEVFLQGSTTLFDLYAHISGVLDDSEREFFTILSGRTKRREGTIGDILNTKSAIPLGSLESIVQCYLPQYKDMKILHECGLRQDPFESFFGKLVKCFGDKKDPQYIKIAQYIPLIRAARRPMLFTADLGKPLLHYLVHRYNKYDNGHFAIFDLIKVLVKLGCDVNMLDAKEEHILDIINPNDPLYAELKKAGADERYSRVRNSNLDRVTRWGGSELPNSSYERRDGHDRREIETPVQTPSSPPRFAPSSSLAAIVAGRVSGAIHGGVEAAQNLILRAAGHDPDTIPQTRTLHPPSSRHEETPEVLKGSRFKGSA